MEHDTDSRNPRPPLRVAIIGAGFGGIAAAVTLRRHGFADITLFEKSGGIGGTWWHNRYPGAATDAASHLYSYSFAPFDWSRTHVGHGDLRAYLDHVVDRFDLRPHIRLETGITSVVWDEAQTAYVITPDKGDPQVFEIVISAVGLFGKPRWPTWPGLADFKGDVLHTAQWPEHVDLAGKRVAVVGTGSSAAQVVPALVDKVAQLTLFQRQPGWLLPKLDRDFASWQRALLRNPILRKLYRLKLYMAQEIREWNGRYFKPGATPNTQARDAALAYIADVFKDRPDLRAIVTPDYPFAGKRAVVSSDFFPALLRPKVTVVPKAVAACTTDGLTDVEGQTHPADAIILCTGFEATRYLSSFNLVGRDGRSLHDVWGDEPHAFCGMMMPGFPNFFMLYGPNTNGGLIVTNLERQARFVALELRRLVRRGLRSVEVSAQATERYNAWLQGRMTGTAFVDGQNYFKAPSGRVVTQWPDNATQYGLRLGGLRRFGRWRKPAAARSSGPKLADADMPVLRRAERSETS